MNAPTQTQVCAQVAVPLPVNDPFSYLIPDALTEKIKPGIRVLVPFKNREITGYVTEIAEISDEKKLKPIQSVLDEDPVLSPTLLALTRWIRDYYGSSWGESIENALPKWVKYGKKADRALKKKEALLEPDSGEKKADFKLSPDQEKAMEIIRRSFLETEPKPILLLGVTGSGKSELYIRSIHEVLREEKSAICLVPEIALTEQLKLFFLHQFGDRLEILHSKMNDTERFLAWHRLMSGEKRIVLGPRSAIFAPVQKLGLVIMDEEHEGSYKQETNPRYHAREVAEWRARYEKALFIMGSATPSLETMYRTTLDEVRKVELTSRIDDKPLPKVQVIDLKRNPGPSKKTPILSQLLIQEIEANLRKKEGTMLLLNRRGFSTHISCPRCGEIENCTSCQVSLTFHQEDGNLLCHYCNYQKPVSTECANCHSPLLRFAGFGTEKIESEVARIFPMARIGRLDADTVQKKGSHEIILKEFRNRKMDILIGTQMIAKGFDFPHVTLVGVVLADVGLMLPDFRSSERTFQLLTQVAGRAGRGNILGRVLVQTFSPDHPSVRFAKDHDFLNFFKQESGERYQYAYPPYTRMINLIIRSQQEQSAYRYAVEVRDAFKEEFGSELFGDQKIDIIGPAPLPFYRLRGHFRWHIMIKFPRNLILTPRIQKALSKIKKSSKVQTALDVDPVNIL